MVACFGLQDVRRWRPYEVVGFALLACAVYVGLLGEVDPAKLLEFRNSNLVAFF